MTNKFPKSFYFKLSFIVCLVLLGFYRNQSFIEATIKDDTLNFSESMTTIFREMMELPQDTRDERVITDTISEYAKLGNQIPYEIDEEILQHDNYLIAKQSAEQFNQSLNSLALNDAFSKQVNHMRGTKGWNPMEIGYHLEEGGRLRVEEMGQYHYLSSLTMDGQDFRIHFPEVYDAQYRLGENLYELYISSGDVHLSTWENPKILADYLFDVYADAISLSNYDIYQSQYLSIFAEPTDYSIDEVPYIRLVVSLVMDTEGVD